MIKKIQCQPLVNRHNKSKSIKFGSLSESTAKFITNHKNIANVIEYSGKNSSLINSFFVFGLSTVLRPLSIMAIPTDKEDKKYSAVRSIATGIAELVFSTAVFLPLSKITDKCCNNLKKNVNTIYAKKPETLKALNTLINRGSRFIVMPVQVFFLFTMITPLVKKLFIEQKKGGKNVK